MYNNNIHEKIMDTQYLSCTVWDVLKNFSQIIVYQNFVPISIKLLTENYYKKIKTKLPLNPSQYRFLMITKHTSHFY